MERYNGQIVLIDDVEEGWNISYLIATSVKLGGQACQEKVDMTTKKHLGLKMAHSRKKDKLIGM